MTDNNGRVSRRTLIKSAGAAGLGADMVPLGSLNAANDAAAASGPTKIPQRPFGQSGIDVSILSLGGVLRSSDQMVFRQAFEKGVTYWDTADSYGWGKNEKAIGKYFSKYPAHREQVFLVTKAATSDPTKLTEKLDTSLQRMNTSRVDMYFIHYVSDVKAELTDAVRAWAETAKSQGKIRLFGFSTHKNMEATMLAAAKLGWIDGIMMSYNYRLMQKDQMKRAVDACVQAGIGLTAMKTQAAFSANFYASIGSETDDALKMTEKFLDKGYTAEQAKLKVVWDNPNIASICSAMPNMTVLQANVAAALNQVPLSAGDKLRLDRYARLTAPGYCAGCATICESMVDGDIPISDLMRYAMYACSYGDRQAAAERFHRLPDRVKARMHHADYAAAEKHCPQQLPIGRVLQQIHDEWA